MTKFKKGQSGNPAGRPKGTPNPQTKIRNAIAADLPKILAVLRDRALDGDAQAASLLLSRCLPPLKPQTEPPEIPLTGANLAERAESIAGATLAGELTPSTATELMAVLAAQARIVESNELAERITRIEAALQRVESPK